MSNRLGFYLAAVGSAFGLGNLWRFPYVAAENGGGAFVLMYLACACLIGLPFLIAELLLGKLSRSSLMPATMKLIGERNQVKTLAKDGSQFPNWVKFSFKQLAWTSLILNLFVLAYYAVISGWVLHFLIRLFFGWIGVFEYNGNQSLHALLSHGWLQVILTGLHLLIIVAVVARDLEQRIEKWVGYSTTVFGILLLYLVYRALELDVSSAALKMFLYPDFSKLTISSLGQAIGHVFFTLSIGFGTMVTFGSYLRDESYLPLAGLRVAALDSLISVFAGILIFPLIIMGHQKEIGPELFFQTVPQLFGTHHVGLFLGLMFFICLYLASLGASIGLLETLVANLRESRRVPRTQGAIWIGVICVIAALIPALSSNVLKSVRVGTMGLLELWDVTLINWLLPIVALFISQMVSWRLRQDLMEVEFQDPKSGSSQQLYSHWIFVLRFVASPIILVGLLLQAWALF